MRPVFALLDLAVAAAFGGLQGKPRATTRLQSQSVDPGDVVLVREKLFKVEQLMAVAVDSTPKAVYQGIYQVGM